MHAIWRFLQTFGVSVPRPPVLASALALLLVGLIAGTLLSVLWENPFLLASLSEGETPQSIELMAFGLDSFSVGYFTIFGLSLAWVAAGGAGARLIWLVLLLLGAVVLACFLGLALYLHEGPVPVAMLLARVLQCLLMLTGSTLLASPEVSAWRQASFVKREADQEARRIRRLARQQQG